MLENNFTFTLPSMKKQSDKIEEFIELRALGYTYDNIQTRINVSKPTLIQWNIKYAELIKRTEEDFAQSLVDKIVTRNIYIIEKILEISYDIAQEKVKNKSAETIMIGRVSKKLYGLFQKKMQSIEFSLSNAGIIKSAKIVWKD